MFFKLAKGVFKIESNC